MSEDDARRTIADVEMAIENGEISRALSLRAELSQAAFHHPHLDPVYCRIYDRITTLGRELAAQRFIATSQ